MRKGISLPRSIEFCHKKIIKLVTELDKEKDLREQEGISASHEIAAREKEILTMCRTCPRRGMR